MSHAAESLGRGARSRLPLKRTVRLVNQKAEEAHRQRLYVGLENVAPGLGRLIDALHGDEMLDAQANLFEPGDVLFGKLRPYLAKAAAPDFPGRCTSELLVLRPHAVLPRFLLYVVLRDEFIKTVNASTYGAKMPRANWEVIGNLDVPVPPPPAQRAIAAFLDWKTKAIDDLIAKKERLVELLAEKRQAFITQAVTKGLDPNVPMKDSGMELLGRVPRHWAVKRLRHISPRLGVGVVVNPSSYVAEVGVPFLFGADVGPGFLRAENARRISDEASKALPASRLRAGDLVTIRVGVTRGWTAVIPPAFAGANCASVMITRGHRTFSSDWLCLAMNSRVGMFQIEAVEYGAAQPQFNVSHATEFVFAVPPRAEQQAIARAVGAANARLDDLVRRVAHQVATLREYRQAVITAAVTGQLEVGGEAA